MTMRWPMALLLLAAGAVSAETPRLLSAGSSITELVLALNAGNQLVATDSTSELPANRSLPRSFCPFPAPRSLRK
mgnify:CR=1 FL=1